ncbi:MAG TPA: B12-binding domain-containing radical SAM protein [Methanotrichaceae archaeon]|nr:B12-binding domain-containing radical SAM protein [Methanotrichaceae archaeon]
MKVLLLSSPIVQPDFDRIARIPNYGLVSIAGNIDDICEVDVADLHAVKKPREYLEGLLKRGYDLVGLSCMSFQYHAMIPLAEMAKESGTATVFGGYHPTLNYDEIAESPEARLADYIVRGEGEATFRELVEAIDEGRDLGDVKGLSYWKGDKMVHNPPRPVLDVSDIKMPNRDSRLITTGFQSFGIPIDSVETSRGCTNGCKFCSIQHMYGKSFRKYPFDRILEDIRDAEAHGAESIFFPDDNMTLDVKRMERLCDAIIEAGLDHLKYKVQASARGIGSSRRLVEKMAKAGFDGVFLGIESTSKENLKFLGKGKMSDNADKAIQYMHDNDIIVSAGLIGGNPEDDESDLWSNYELARRLKVDIPIFYISTPYPKTEMREELEKMDLVACDDYRFYDGLHANLNTKYLTSDEVQYITWEMNARYYDLEWFRYTKIKRLYPKWFLKETLRLAPFYAKRKLGLMLRLKTPRDYFKEDLEAGELCKGVA